MLMEIDPQVYFETDHYMGRPAVLVRLKKISDAKLRYTLEQACGSRHPSGLSRRSTAEAWKRDRSKKERSRPYG
jgi:hypothetical protein